MRLDKTKMDSILNITPKRGVLALLVLSILYLNASTRDNFFTDVRRGPSIDGPQIKRSDFIMRGSMDAPIVVEEFKLVFFIVSAYSFDLLLLHPNDENLTLPQHE